MLAWSILIVLFGMTASQVANAGYVKVTKPYTTLWHSNCTDTDYPTVEAAAASFAACTVYCVVYDTSATPGNPDVWVVGATTYLICSPNQYRDRPVYQPNVGLVNFTGNCSTPYANDPSEFYNAPGYQFEPGTDGWRSHGDCWINGKIVNQTLKPCDLCAGNPLFPGSGNKQQEEVDYDAGGSLPLRFARTYNSASQYGSGWRHSFARTIINVTSDSATLVRPEGVFTFARIGSAWVPDQDVNLKLTGSIYAFQVTSADGREVELYDAYNALSSIQRVSGAQEYVLVYDNSAAHLLTQVRDAFGHALSFSYDGQNRLSTMTDPNGGVYQYTWDANNNLTSVTHPDGNTRTYVYGETSLTSGVTQPNLLTGIVDENGIRFANFGYDATGLAIMSEHAGGAQHVGVSWTTPPKIVGSVVIDAANHTETDSLYFQAPTGTAVTDALGRTRTYTFTIVDGVPKATGSSAPCSGPCTPVPQSQSFDANGNVTSKTDFNGNITHFTFDQTRNLETSRTEAYGTPRARTITTSWSPAFRLPATITEANRTTGFTFDASGHVLTKTITDTSVMPTVSRTWTYTYNGYGQVLTEDGPRSDVSDVTTYTYYSCSTGYQCGQLATVTIALNQTTTYNSYNAHGQPLTLTDPNGVLTTLTYDARQRLTSRQVGTETTSFSYWPTGLLKKVTLPDGSYVQYTYDAAHRLSDITDGSGNKIHYTLDAMGNRTAENTYDPSNALHRTHSRVYNNLNQLYQDINAAGTTATTTLGYDPNGNQTSISAPLSRNTTNQYDELNRLKQITDPGNGVTQFGYDANDNLTQVTDPRSLVTSYTYTGFGDLKTQTSPDTGLTAHTFDSGGNLKTSTDARGALATYSYDALNRVTQVAYTDQAINFGYDAGTNGKGRLTSASDANHSMSWSYDAQGRVTGKGQTVGTVTKSIGYGYANGNPVTISLPSGQLVTYQYNANHQITGITLGTGTPVTLLSNITYEPFGPVKSWTWGNSTTMSRTYDADGRVTSMASGGVLSLNPIVYDEASRITGITDTKTSTNSWSYGYDAMDRLSSASKSGTSYGWTYDANGNRKTQTGTSATTYTISTTSNRLTNLSGATTRTYGFDASGNITSYDSWSFTYNKRNRMSGASSGANSTSYVYNALGQMIRKSGSAPGLMMYDEAGHLVGEYTSTGTLTQETIWLGDIPVATIRPNGTSYDIYYVHTDQIDTPKVISRPSDNKLRWRWDLSSPFGGGAANENPASLGAFSYNLRFPGQIAMSETGNRQNGFRVYESFTGRYLQSDPVGIVGGVNTYAYGYDNPVGFYDPSGLTSIQVNVASGMMLVDPEVKGRPPYSIPITSGRGQCQNNPKCSANKNQGPLPPGKYQLNVSEISQLGAFGTLLRQLRGDWGSWRVPLHPLPATNVMGRSGFFLHGGQIPGSAGCIDFGGGIFGNSLTDELLQDIRNDPNGIVPLTVQ